MLLCVGVVYQLDVLPLPKVLCLITPWLRLNRSIQKTQLTTLSREVLLACAFRLGREASITVSSKIRRNKDTLAEFIISVIRTSLEAVQNGTTVSYPRHVLVRLRLTENPNILRDHNEFLDYFRRVLEPSVFNAIISHDEDMDSVTQAKRARYTARKPRSVIPHELKKPPAASPLEPVSDWPQLVPKHTIMKCCRNYYEGTKWLQPQACAVCDRAQHGAKMLTHLVPSSDLTFPLLDILRISHLSPLFDTPRFQFGHTLLDNIMLSSAGIVKVDGGFKLNVCDQCNTPLMKNPQQLPKFALKNNLYRGELPDHLLDLTWVEEQVCALYRSTAIVTRLYGSDDPAQPHIFRGNTCAFAQNTVSTAQKLPRTPADVNDLLSVVFTGSNSKVPESCLKKVFRVRKQKIQDFLAFLTQNNHLYHDIEIDYMALDSYPSDGALPGIGERIILNHVSNTVSQFDEESASFEPHPSNQLFESGTEASEESPHVFLESTGVFDSDNADIPARLLTSSAIRNLIPKSKDQADLILHRAENPEPEYGNTNLFPGMFPTLFPLGFGGFDDSLRPVAIGLRTQAEYFLDLSDKRFRRHRCFIFHTLNVHQRRTAHLWSGLTVRKGRYNAIAPVLTALDPKLIESVATHIANEGKISDLTPEQKKVMTLVQEVNTIGAKIPGSSSSKLLLRNEIRAYMGYFGLPHLYLTLNPSAGHSPVFQAVWGDDAVDLSQRFPDLAPSHERAIRLASDPIAGADFFSFMIEQFFTHLLGWDYVKKRSSPEGGIFGRIRAYYGTAEFTERGQLHGHFLIWLDGGLNPSDVHERMKKEPEWQKQFFDFFEDIIKHHLPETDDEPTPNRELRAERPPHPDHADFDQEILSDIKLLGEQVQRHDDPCRKNVCFKYGSKECRFGFPHEIVEKSSFNEEDNSITFKCLDSLVNYHNPWILAFTRHNHDLKSILSGKSAKAAMLYISDYMVKNDENMSQVLTMYSTAVAAIPPEGVESTSKQQSRTLLHKCLAARIRAQNIHAQQAARYLRGNMDGMCTHDTVNMMSSAVVSYLAKSFADMIDLADDENEHADDGDEDGDGKEDNYVERDQVDKEVEGAEIRIRVDNQGHLYECNQVDDYLHRDDELASLSFYDFVRCYRKQKRINSTVNDGRLRRYKLQTPHAEAATHFLIEFADPVSKRPALEVIPRVVGRSIPRRTKDEKYYATFMLSHFAPFSYSRPLMLVNQDIVSTFDQAKFSNKSLAVMKNWEAIHECEDQREAERLKKRSNKLKEAKERVQAVKAMLPPEYLEDPDAYVLAEEDFRHEKMDNETLHLRCALINANWLKTNEPSKHSGILKNTQTAYQMLDSKEIILPDRLNIHVKSWESHIDQQAAMIANARRAQLDPTRQESAIQTVAETQSGNNAEFVQPNLGIIAPVPETKSAEGTLSISSDSWEDRLKSVEHEFTLNKEQCIAFRITARRLHEILLAPLGASKNKPLRMMMTGPGGTGKTHVVNALYALMKQYNCGYKIRFLAPTGAAAVLIGGQTIHSGFGIKPRAKSGKKDSNDDNTLQYTISERKKAELRAEWRNVDFVLIDEVSMVSAELLCELDSVLRFAKEANDWFGGINIIFSGDFYQHRPVKQRSLIVPITPGHGRAKGIGGETLTAKQHQGRMVWKQVDTVVELIQQKRMENDPEFAQAVLHLRGRCTDADDLDLFNSLEIKGPDNPKGVDLSEGGWAEATVLVDKNVTRRTLNEDKALASTHGELVPDLVTCHAKHVENSKLVSKQTHSHFLDDLDADHLPLLKLYVGAPVILKQNICQELNIVNGSQGILRKIELESLYGPDGPQHATVALVEFPNSPIHLPGLPKGYFPIQPVRCLSKTIVFHKETSKSIQIEAARFQLPIQLAFAITGHGAQGRTMNKVLYDLSLGGNNAYVAASRARDRKGLAITKRIVSTAQLNKPHSFDLIQEMKRLDVLAHNTLVKYGYAHGKLKDVPDPEHGIRPLSISFEENATRGKGKTVQSKRKGPDSVATVEPAPKRQKIAPVATPDGRLTDRSTDMQLVKCLPSANNSSLSSIPGCTWDRVDYSCPYDACIVPLIYLIKDANSQWRTLFQEINASTNYLTNATLSLCSNNIAKKMNEIRDVIRDLLSRENPTAFPRRGAQFASTELVWNRMTRPALVTAKMVCARCTHTLCEVDQPKSLGEEVDLDSINECRVIRGYMELDGTQSTGYQATIDFRDWLAGLLYRSIQSRVRRQGKLCLNCSSTGPWFFETAVSRPTPLLMLNCYQWQFLDGPNLIISLTSKSENGAQCLYRLCSIIYFGSAHFTCRFIALDGSIWSHDGQTYGGSAILESTMSNNVDFSFLNMRGSAKAALLVYSLVN